MGKIKVVSVGSVNMDLSVTCQRVPVEGETVLGNNYNMVAGGKGANQIVTCAKLQENAYLVGNTGDDRNGKVLREILQNQNVNIEYLFKQKSKTGFANILIDENGKNRIIVVGGANMDNISNINNIIKKIKPDIMLLQLEINKKTTTDAFKSAVLNDIPVVVDLSPVRNFDLNTFKNVDIISPNETEAEYFTGIRTKNTKSIKKASKKLSDITNAKYVIIKMGDKGSLIFDGHNYKHIEAYNVKAKDTTAAGDVFTAACACEYAKGREIVKCVEFATAAAAITVTKFGASPSVPNREETIKFIKSHKK